MSALYISDGSNNNRQETLEDRGRDKLKADALNAIPGPIMARFAGGHAWPVIDFEVETALMRIDVVGQSQVMHFCEVVQMTDIEGNDHDPETFWTDYE